jgi:hypothetical protein
LDWFRSFGRLSEPVIESASARGRFRDDEDGAGSANTARKGVLMWAELTTPTAEMVRRTSAVLSANTVGCDKITGESKSGVRSVRSRKYNRCRNAPGIEISAACGRTSRESPERVKSELLD